MKDKTDGLHLNKKVSIALFDILQKGIPDIPQYIAEHHSEFASPYHHAAFNNDIKFFEADLAFENYDNLVDSKGHTPTDYAAMMDHLEVFHFLLLLSKFKDQFYRQALLFAAMFGNQKIITYLLQNYGQDLKKTPNLLETAFQAAFIQQHFSIITIFLQANLFQPRVLKDQFTAANKQHGSYLKLLIAQGQLKLMTNYLNALKRDPYYHHEAQETIETILNSNIKLHSLDLSRLTLLNHHFDQLLPRIKKSVTLRAIDLSNNGLTHGCADQLIALLKLPFLIELNLNFNVLGGDKKRSAIIQLAKILHKNTTLEKLSLRGCRLAINDLQVITEVFKHNKTLQSLDIRENPLLKEDKYLIIPILNTFVNILQKHQHNLRSLEIDQQLDFPKRQELFNSLRQESVNILSVTPSKNADLNVSFQTDLLTSRTAKEQHFESSLQRKLSMYWIAVNCIGTGLVEISENELKSMTKRLQMISALMLLIPHSIHQHISHGFFGIFERLFESLHELVASFHVTEFVTELPVIDYLFHHMAEKLASFKTITSEQMLHNIINVFSDFDVCNEECLIIAKAITHRYSAIGELENIEDITKLADATARMILDYWKMGFYHDNAKNKSLRIHQDILNWLFYSNEFYYKEKNPFTIQWQTHQLTLNQFYTLPGLKFGINAFNKETSDIFFCDMNIINAEAEILIRTQGEQIGLYRNGSLEEAEVLKSYLELTKGRQIKTECVEFNIKKLGGGYEKNNIKAFEFNYKTKTQRLIEVEEQNFSLVQEVKSLKEKIKENEIKTEYIHNQFKFYKKNNEIKLRASENSLEEFKAKVLSLEETYKNISDYQDQVNEQYTNTNVKNS